MQNVPRCLRTYLGMDYSTSLMHRGPFVFGELSPIHLDHGVANDKRQERKGHKRESVYKKYVINVIRD